MSLTAENLGHRLRLIADDNPLVIAFFVAYSRAEYALKRAGYFYARPGGNDPATPTDVVVNWQSFGGTVDTAYRHGADVELDAAIAYLIENPPKRQAIVGAELGWANTQRKAYQSDVQWVLTLIATVRNNLCHGGKYPGTVVSGPERNADLLRSSLVVLGRCIEWHPQVEGFFWGD